VWIEMPEQRPVRAKRRRRRTGRRAAGVVATLALFGVAAAITLMVLPGGRLVPLGLIPFRAEAPAIAGDDSASAAADRRRARRAAVARRRERAREARRDRARARARARRRAAERRARGRAVALLRANGYEPARLADYRARAGLRVLVGRSGGGSRAFFFSGDRFVGNDATAPSGRLRVAAQRGTTVTLAYGLAAGGSARVRYRWQDGRLTPLDPIPPAYVRSPVLPTQ
jgi:LppP/LprE lipoprotein